MITRSELLDVIYRFYPRGVRNVARIYVPPGEPFYDDTEEHLRLVEAARRGREEYPTWDGMLSPLDNRYGLQNDSLNLLAGWVVPAYSARIWLTNETALSFHVSLLGPYYGLHIPSSVEEDPVTLEVVQRIEQEIHATYPGYRTIPPEIGNEVVPDVAMDMVSLGEGTIYIGIFSNAWTNVDPGYPFTP